MKIRYLQFQKHLITKSIPLGVFIFFSIFINHLNNDVFAAPSDETPRSLSLLVRQEKYQTDGVLVTHPNAIDSQVQSLIRCQNLHSLEEYLIWLSQHIQYQKDIEEIWSNPIELLQSQKGDCEDYAFLNATVTRMLGYKSHILALIHPRSKQNHVICSFLKDGRYYLIDNKNLRKTSSTTLPELAKFIISEYKSSYLLEYQIETQTWAILSASSS